MSSPLTLKPSVCTGAFSLLSMGHDILGRGKMIRRQSAWQREGLEDFPAVGLPQTRRPGHLYLFPTHNCLAWAVQTSDGGLAPLPSGYSSVTSTSSSRRNKLISDDQGSIHPHAFICRVSSR